MWSWGQDGGQRATMGNWNYLLVMGKTQDVQGPIMYLFGSEILEDDQVLSILAFFPVWKQQYKEMLLMIFFSPTKSGMLWYKTTHAI